MRPIAYVQRTCTDSDRVAEFLVTQRVAVLGIDGGEYPYAVPVNYVWLDGSFYFHGMGSGRKVELLAADAAVCVTVFHEFGTVPDPMPCHADTAYLSVMAFGRAQRVDDPGEAAQALQALVDKLLPDHYRKPLGPAVVVKHRSAMDGNPVAVYRVTPVHLTAKENVGDPQDVVRPGPARSDA